MRIDGRVKGLLNNLPTISDSGGELVKLHLASNKLKAVFTSSPLLASFDDNLKKAGVKIKSWRAKLWNYFSKKKKKRDSLATLLGALSNNLS